VVAKDVLAIGKAERGFVDAFRIRDAEVVVADDAAFLALFQRAHVNTL